MTAMGMTFTIMGIFFILVSAVLLVTTVRNMTGVGLGLVLFFFGCVMYVVPIFAQQQKPYETVLLIPVLIVAGPVLGVLFLIALIYVFVKIIIVLSSGY